MESMNSEKWVSRFCGALALATACGVAPVGAQTVAYDQGDYRIQTTLNETFLGRNPDGTAWTGGGYLYEGRFTSNPIFGFTWTRGDYIEMSDTWEGVLLAEPGSLITVVSMSPTLTSWMDRYHASGATLTFEVFSDASYGTLLHSQQKSYVGYTQGPGGIGENGDPFDPAFTGSIDRVYVRYTQYLWGDGRSEYAAYSSSEIHISRFELDAGTVSAPAVSPVPEPETYAMLLAGLGLLGWHARRRKQKEAALA